MPITIYNPCTVAAGPSNRADEWVEVIGDLADPKNRFAHNTLFMQAIVGV